MGLGIYVNKVIALGDRSPDDVSDYVILDESPQLEMFRHLAFDKIIQEYDHEMAAENIGLKLIDLEYKGCSFGRSELDPEILEEVFMYKNKKHPLYEADKWMQENWANYFDTMEELIAWDKFKDFKENILPLAIAHGWQEEYFFYASGSKTNHYNLVSAWKYIEEQVAVNIINPPAFTLNKSCVTYENVGYQSGGENKLFREEQPVSPVVSLSVLVGHWERYFQYIADIEKNPALNDTDFKKNIIDEFVEGETFVDYC